MHKYFFISLFLLILTEFSYPQDIHSLQINAGLIKPMSSSNGLSGMLQYNYSVSKILDLYAYTGYSSWDRYKLKIMIDRTEYSHPESNFTTAYPYDEHILIPVYIGGQVNFHTNELFNSFVNIELGYNYLSYNSYDLIPIKNPETGDIEKYQADITSKQTVKENLIGVGIGAGISHPISTQLSLVFTFKLNSYMNSNYYGFLSTRGTYTMFLGGFSYKI